MCDYEYYVIVLKVIVYYFYLYDYEMLLTIGLNLTCRKYLQEDDDETFSRRQVTKSVKSRMISFRGSWMPRYRGSSKAEFEMNDLGPSHYFLGLEVWQGSDEIFPWSMKIHSGDPEEIRDDGLQVHANIDGS